MRPVANPLEAELAQARAEAEAAERVADRLGEMADRQRDTAGKLRAQQEAAVQAIAAAEARISAADTEARLLAVRLAAQRELLRRQRAPAAALLGGVAMMAQRPPILVLADKGGTDEFVRVRLLLDATLPAIRRRTASLSRQLADGRRLETQFAAARQSAVAERRTLQDRQAKFESLEQQALRSAEESGSAALGAGDVALSRGEAGEALASAVKRGRSATRIAAEVASLGTPANRPFPPEGGPVPTIVYRLPAAAPVTEGFGSISENGIRARGITLATRRGMLLAAPADGTILFAGPYRSQDGILIIDHGGGWKTLILNASSELAKGATFRSGDPIARALGPIGVELSRNGQHLSPAIIAGSSATLSK